MGSGMLTKVFFYITWVELRSLSIIPNKLKIWVILLENKIILNKFNKSEINKHEIYNFEINKMCFMFPWKLINFFHEFNVHLFKKINLIYLNLTNLDLI